MWIVLSLNKPRASLRGYCRRFLLEPVPNMFVGKANRVLAEDLTIRLEESGIEAVMVCQHRKSDTGMSIKIFGTPSRTVVDMDGLHLISVKSSK